MAKIFTSDYILELVIPHLDSMDAEAFFSFCAKNDGVQIERDETGEVIIMPLDYPYLSIIMTEVATDLGKWNEIENGGVSVGANAGFYLPDTSMRSPDLAWISLEKWNCVDEKERWEFAHITPEFVMEVMQPYYGEKYAKAKMLKWIQNGVLLGWLLNPKKQEVYIYRADNSITTIEGFNAILSGEDVLPGFEFDLRTLG